MKPPTQAQRDFIATRKAVQQMDHEIRQQAEMDSLWRSCYQEDWVGESLKLADELKQQKEARSQDLRMDMLRAELDV